MTTIQKKFKNKFTRAAFVTFLALLDDEEVAKLQLNTDNCFIGAFLKKIFPKSKVNVEWFYCNVDDERLQYPPWCADYLSYLFKLMNVGSPEFAAAARKASSEWLAEYKD